MPSPDVLWQHQLPLWPLEKEEEEILTLVTEGCICSYHINIVPEPQLTLWAKIVKTCNLQVIKIYQSRIWSPDSGAQIQWQSELL